jgi:hypothetical protein
MQAKNEISTNPRDEALKFLSENPPEKPTTAARIFKVNASSLRTARQRAAKPESIQGGHNKILSEAQIKAVYKYVEDSYHAGYGASKQMVFTAICHLRSAEIPSKLPPSWRWFQGFMKAHPDLFRVIKSKAIARVRTPQSRLLTTPYRAWYGHDPHYRHMRTPGTKCLALERLRSKDTDNAVQCKLLGYEGDHIYRLVTTTGRLIRASSVQFAAEKRGLDDAGASEPLAKRQHSLTSGPDLWGDDEIIQVTPSPEREPLPRRPHTPVPARESRPRIAKGTTYHPLERALLAAADESAIIDEPCFIALIANTDSSEPYEPRTYRQAVSGENAKQWEESMEDEVNSLTENHTWDLVDRPKDRAVTGKWVYKHKRGLGCEILRYKSRWVVRGFEQREGLDYYETFASVVKPMSYKLLFAIAAANDLEIEQMDVKTAFLYGNIDTEIYVEQPEGMGAVGESHKVCKLNKALYGLKQSPRVWYFTLTAYLKALGFKPLTADNCIFHDSNGTYLAVFVDDLLIIGPSKANISAIKAKLSERFRMTDLEVTRGRRKEA